MLILGKHDIKTPVSSTILYRLAVESYMWNLRVSRLLIMLSSHCYQSKETFSPNQTFVRPWDTPNFQVEGSQSPGPGYEGRKALAGKMQHRDGVSQLLLLQESKPRHRVFGLPFGNKR